MRIGRARVLAATTMAVALFALAGAGTLQARVPEPDHTFYGEATISGAPIFDSVITVERRVGGVCAGPGNEVLASVVVPPDPGPGYVYMLRVPIDSIDPADPGTARKDDPVCFFIDGTLAGAGLVGERGEATPLDIDTDFDAGVARLTIGDVQLFEGNAGTAQWGFTVSIAPTSASEIIFTYETQSGSALGGPTCADDFIEVPAFPAAEVTIPALGTSVDVMIDVCGDGTIEPDETFFVNLVDIFGGVIEDGQAAGLIRDDDADPRLAIDDVTVAEGNGASVNAVFTVTLSRPADESVFVDYLTVAGTAEEDIDYALTSGTLEITIGQQDGTIPVEVFADAINEGEESFTLVLSNARLEGPVVPLTIDDDTGVATVTDDEHFLEWDERWKDGLDGVDGLDQPVASVLSPNQRHLYLAGQADNAISIFKRETSGGNEGRLTFLDFVEDGLGQGVVQGIQSISGVALADDGKFLYATGATSSAVTVFDRNRLSGTIDFIQVLADGDVDGGNTVDGLSAAAAVAVSPGLGDGHVYVAGRDDDAIAVFARDPFTGLLSYVETASNGTAGITGLAGVSALALSSDGNHLYAAGELENSVVVFSRDNDSQSATFGELTFVERVEDGVSAVDGLARASAVAVEPDGDHVYVTGRSDDALAVFSRNPGTGALTFLEVHVDGAAPVDGLRGASSVAVAPAGNFVYATGFLDDAVAVFERDDTTGLLEYVEARRNSEADVDGIARPASVAVSGDGLQVYVGGSEDDAVAVFFVDDQPPVNPTALDSTSHVASVPSAVAVIDMEWSGATDGVAGSGIDGYSVAFDNSAGTAVDTTVEVDHGPDPNTTSSTALGDGSWWFHLRACDRAGNCDPTTMHAGPFVIDTSPPPPPAGPISSSHGGEPSENPVIGMQWTAATDAASEGRAGYTAWFDGQQAATCNRTVNVDAHAAALRSAPMANGSWYFHICAVDGAGNRSTPVSAGPFIVARCHDEDGDGFGLPGAVTCPRGAADDCDDGNADLRDARTWYADIDGDGYGDAATEISSCSQPEGFVDEDGDCDDSAPRIHPAASESCSNAIDDNCNGLADAQDACCSGSGRQLNAGWNLVAASTLLSSEEPAETSETTAGAEQACEAIRLGGGLATHVAGHDGSGWRTHACGADDGTDFSVDVDRAYFVRTDRPSSWCSRGLQIASPHEIGLAAGWNSFSLPAWATGASASAVCRTIERAGGTPVEVTSWSDGGWRSHTCGLPHNDFRLEADAGYMVRLDAPSSWPLYGAFEAAPSRPSPAATSVDEATEPSGSCSLRVANRRATGFTVVWTTAEPTAGFVRFGTDPDELDGVACHTDDASDDCSGLRRSHFVNVTGLSPATTYHVEIVGDPAPEGEAIEVTTGSVLVPSAPGTMQGRVALGESGPGEGAYVCVGAETPACDWVGPAEGGYWSLDSSSTTVAEPAVEACAPSTQLASPAAGRDRQR